MTASRAERAKPLEIGGHTIAPGEQLRFDLPVALLPTHTQLDFPVCVVNGLKKGPRLWLSAAVHGDEINGVEIISQVLGSLPSPLRAGAVIAVPIVNVFGFLDQSRYLPDRRDLNRSFPGSKKGSLASRVANLFLTEIVERCTHGIDLHTAAIDRANYPQVRGNLTDPVTRRIAEAFAAPAMVHSPVRAGSLRGAATKRGIPVIVYEGGEPLRFNKSAIEVGVRGVQNVLRELGMTGRPRRRSEHKKSMYVRDSSWVRARRGGLLHLSVEGGSRVHKGQVIGSVADPFGAERVLLRAPFEGLVIGQTNNPIVHAGDAVVHVGEVLDPPPGATDDPGPGGTSDD